jgi:hypothetical protein
MRNERRRSGPDNIEQSTKPSHPGDMILNDSKTQKGKSGTAPKRTPDESVASQRGACTWLIASIPSLSIIPNRIWRKISIPLIELLWWDTIA